MRFKELFELESKLFASIHKGDNRETLNVLDSMEECVHLWRSQGITFQDIVDEKRYYDAAYEWRGDRFMEQVEFLFR